MAMDPGRPVSRVRSFLAGSAALTRWNVPMRLMSTIHLTSSMSCFSISCATNTPWLQTRTSTGPASCSALDGARVPHVRREDADVLPRCGVDGSARVVEPRGVAGEDGDPRALARGGRGHSEPDAAGPARDEHVAAREQDARAAGARQEGERGEEADGRRQQQEEEGRRGHGDEMRGHGGKSWSFGRRCRRSRD
jgi:hypothetical protein